MLALGGLIATMTVAFTPGSASAYITGSGHASQLHNLNSGLCLDDLGFSTAWGHQMGQWQCNGRQNQDWWVDTLNQPVFTTNRVMIRNGYSSLCLSVWQNRMVNFQPIVQWPCSVNDNAEQFSLLHYSNGTWALLPWSDHSKAVEVGYASRTWGATVNLYDWNGPPCQYWW